MHLFWISNLYLQVSHKYRDKIKEGRSLQKDWELHRKQWPELSLYMLELFTRALEGKYLRYQSLSSSNSIEKSMQHLTGSSWRPIFTQIGMHIQKHPAVQYILLCGNRSWYSPWAACALQSIQMNVWQLPFQMFLLKSAHNDDSGHGLLCNYQSF